VKVAESCPLISTCDEDIHEEVFETCCVTGAWIYCDKAEEKARKFLKKPREWQKEAAR
jgi:hypothetical protein